MDNINSRRITAWIRWQAFDLGGPRYLSTTLHKLFVLINTARDTAWDVDAILASITNSPERQRRIDALCAEFYEACSTKLNAGERQQLLNEIRSGEFNDSSRESDLFVRPLRSDSVEHPHTPEDCDITSHMREVLARDYGLFTDEEIRTYLRILNVVNSASRYTREPAHIPEPWVSEFVCQEHEELPTK